MVPVPKASRVTLTPDRPRVTRSVAFPRGAAPPRAAAGSAPDMASVPAASPVLRNSRRVRRLQGGMASSVYEQAEMVSALASPGKSDKSSLVHGHHICIIASGARLTGSRHEELAFWPDARHVGAAPTACQRAPEGQRTKKMLSKTQLIEKL